MTDAEFSPDTKRIIAGRAGYRCSYPGCDRTTIGPSDKPEKTDSTGMACHIWSAADVGPRGTGGLSIDDRKKSTNGIWCCYTHGKLIDNNDGVNYPASVLLQWKHMQESRIDHEHRGIAVPFGWLSRADFRQSPLFVRNTSIHFGKVNLFVGPNGTGKTAICQLIAAAGGDLRHLWRWKRTDEGSDIWDFDLHYACPEPHVFRGQIGNEQISFSIDEVAAADINHGLRFVYLDGEGFSYEAMDDVDFVANFCGVHRERVIQAIRHLRTISIPPLNSISISDQPIHEEEGFSEEQLLDLNHKLKLLGLRSRQKISASIGNHNVEWGFGRLGSREQSIVLTSIGIGLASLLSRHAPTVLITDIGGRFLPDDWLSNYTRELSRDIFQFQTILISPRVRPDVNWTGWSVSSFEGGPPNVQIGQDDLTAAIAGSRLENLKY